MGVTYIKTLKGFLKTLRDSADREIIVYRQGGEGNTLMEYLRYTDRLKYICCIATVGKPQENVFFNLRSMIALDSLTHFYKTAIFVVAVPLELNDEICQELSELGCNTVVCLEAKVHSEIRGELQELKYSGDVMLWHMDYFFKRSTQMEYFISMQNEVCKVNTAAFGAYENCFKGKKVVIVGCGPTAKYYKPIPGAIHIALNRAFLHEDITFNFLFTLDSGGEPVNGRPEISDGFDNILDRVFVGKSANTYGGSYPESISFKARNVSRYFYFPGPTALRQTIYRNISYHPLTSFHSVATGALQFAFYTYPAEIYLVGCDTTNDGHFFYFDEDDLEKYGLNTTFLKVGYARFKLFADKHYPDTRIISVNPVALKGLFEDVYTDDYKALMLEQFEQ